MSTRNRIEEVEIGLQIFHIKLIQMKMDVFEKLKLLIIKQRGKTKIPLNRNTSLENDLLISGIDAVNLMNKYSQEFEVDLSGFIFSDYFNSEGFSLTNLWHKKESIKELTLGDLEKGIIAKRLDQGVIEKKL